MIIGYKPVSKEELDNIYDYIGVLYPEGFLSNEYNFLFNHEDINDVVFKGYNNPEREDVIALIDEKYQEQEKEM